MILIGALSNTDAFNADVTAEGLWRRARRARGDRAQGREAYLRAFNELADYAYLFREKKRRGRRLVTEVTAYDTPQLGLDDFGQSPDRQSDSGGSTTRREHRTSNRGEGGPSEFETSTAPESPEKTTSPEKLEKRNDGLWDLLARIPDRSLLRPQTDRSALQRRAERLLKAGLPLEQVRVLLSGIGDLGRPFGALMRRMGNLSSAQAFLDGHLGRGVHRPWNTGVDWGVAPEPWPDSGQGQDDSDLFDRPSEFILDALGKADKTCPEHPGVRNHPGGRCLLCQGPCRDVPGEIVHPQAPPPIEAPAEGRGALKGLIPSPRSGQDPLPPTADPDQGELDPKLLERMGASMRRGGRSFEEGGPRAAPGTAPGQGHDVARTGASLARMQLAQALGLGPGDLPGAPDPTRVGAPGVLTSARAPGGG
ncbi:hypothetical protein [Nocardiopsis listeri]|uniref:hypothetical protein n=1 Tax=Nocardiopsis listeri TaxID=53440 RepID=UPI0012EE2B73|nr:hypothetical protein [Nocardiopsis listeri]